MTDIETRIERAILACRTAREQAVAAKRAMLAAMRELARGNPYALEFVEVVEAGQRQEDGR